MSTNNITAILFLAILTIVVGQELIRNYEQADIKDICHWQNFNPTCDEGHVIRVHYAKYGRLRYGECITPEYGNTDCATDVLRYMDEQCSGRRSCNVYVADLAKHQKSPCPLDLTSYLAIAYTCVKVAWPANIRCDSPLNIAAQDASAFIGSDVTVQSGIFGTANCPWLISAPEGQTIRLTLYTFGKGKITDVTATIAQGSGSFGASSSSSSTPGCYELGMVRERQRSQDGTSPTHRGGVRTPSGQINHDNYWGQERKILSCASNSFREQELITTRTDQVEVTLLEGDMLKNLAPFLIKYEVRGCKTLKAPAGGTIQTDGPTAVVQCNNTRNTWYLTCINNDWIGEKVNCSAEVGQAVNVASPSNTGYTFPIGILLIVAIGVALGVFLGGILLTLVAMHMKRRHQRPPPIHHEDYYETYKLKGPVQNKENKHLDPSLYYGLNDDVYAPTLHRKDCPEHGHLIQDHVINTPDVCNEHMRMQMNQMEPNTTYLSKQTPCKDPYESLHMDQKLNDNQTRQQPLVLV